MVWSWADVGAAAGHYTAITGHPQNGAPIQAAVPICAPLRGGLPEWGQITRLTYTDGASPGPLSPYPVVDKPGNDDNPAVSPDGTKLAFVSDRTGQAQLYLMGYHPQRAAQFVIRSSSPHATVRTRRRAGVPTAAASSG